MIYFPGGAFDLRGWTTEREREREREEGIYGLCGKERRQRKGKKVE